MTERNDVVTERKRPHWDLYFLTVAQVISTRSHDEQTQVGAVIVRENRIISTGYNGFPPGLDDESLPKTRPEKYRYMVHAEINALVSCATDLREATLYCTHSPCAECAKALCSSGISRVVYVQKYDNESSAFALELMRMKGMLVDHIFMN